MTNPEMFPFRRGGCRRVFFGLWAMRLAQASPRIQFARPAVSFFFFLGKPPLWGKTSRKFGWWGLQNVRSDAHCSMRFARAAAGIG